MSGRELYCVTFAWRSRLEDLKTVERRAGSQWVFFGESATQYYVLKQSLSVWGDPINTGQLLNRVASEIRREFINFDEQLETHEHAMIWQTTDTAEKNPYTSQFFLNCCKFLAFCRILKSLEADLLVVIDDWFLSRFMERHARSVGFSVKRVSGNTLEILCPEQLRLALYRFAQALRFIKSRVSFAVEFLQYQASIRGNRRGTPLRHSSMRKTDVLLATWAEADTFCGDMKVRENTWFGGLPGIFDDHGYRVMYLATPLSGSHSQKKVTENIASARDTVLLLQESLRWRDMVAIILLSLVRPWRMTCRFIVQGQDLTDLLHQESFEERAKPRQCWAMQFYYVARFLGDKGIKPKVLIYPYENQPWEKALLAGFRRYLPATRIAAYQHAPFAPLWLGAFPSQKDFRTGQIPDNLVILGPLWKHVFLQEGFPERSIIEGPALRFEHLFRQNGHEESSALAEKNEGGVLVAGSIGYGDTLELTLKTIDALRVLPEIRVKLKFHPKMGDRAQAMRLVRSALECLGLERLPLNFEVTREPVEQLLSKVQVVIHNGTSVAQEAIAAKRKVLLVQSDLWLDMDTLAWWPSTQTRARTPAEIREAVVQFLVANSGSSSQGTGGSALQLSEMFAPVNGQTVQCFLGFVSESN